MSTRLTGVVFDAARPDRLARFWADALGWAAVTDEHGHVAVEDGRGVAWAEGGGPRLRFVAAADTHTGKNRVHVDLVSSSASHQEETVRRLLHLGARHLDIGQGDVPWVVLGDPEGNELCVLEPRDDYAGTCGIAAVVIDSADPAKLAGFWAEATGWPAAGDGSTVVALRAPGGAGTYLELLATGQRPLGGSRLRLEVTSSPGVRLDEAAARLERAGTRRLDASLQAWGRFADPEGNEVWLSPPQ